MAILNGLYIHVVDETYTADMETTTHPVESGVPLTDAVKPKAACITLSGKIVDYGDMTAEKVIAKLKSLKDSGSLIEYRGRNVASSMLIQSFETKHPYTNSGGADFDIKLVQARIAKSAYVPKKTTTTTKNPTIKVGSIVVFKGGSVYVSSDAKKAASTRGRSTCKCTQISTKSWSIHQYHLISNDGKGVYGWVDKKDIEGTSTTSTSSKTNAGTQQVKTGNKTAVYHTVKKGDTVYTIVNVKYKYVGTSTSEFMSNNPKAFAVSGSARTLKVGVKVFIGYISGSTSANSKLNRDMRLR